MTDPRRIGVSIDVKPHAYDPAVNPELFEGVLARRFVAFLIDVTILAIPVMFAAVFIFIFGVITLGIGWALYWLLSPAAAIWAICYYGYTFGSPASATIGMRVMDLEMRTWYGAPAYFVLGAVHAIVYWVTVSFLTPFILLVAFFNHRRRLLHDMLVGTIVINNPARAQALRAPPRLRARALRERASRERDLTGAAARAILSASAMRRRSRHPVTQHSRNTPQFYLTAPSPCPYLPGQEERKVFTHLVGERAAELNDLLTHGGFRRSQSIAYRPACETCRACVSVRVVAEDFRPTRSMRRILDRNRDLIGEMRVSVPTAEQYSVFRSYLDARHRDGGMADMTLLDYALMVEDSHVETRMVEYRRRGPDSSINGRGSGELLAVALTDLLSDGLSMVYSFFDSDHAARSLGTFMILDHITRARQMGLAYVYLGYWVQGSRKMDYKARFLPQQRLAPDGWVRVEE